MVAVELMAARHLAAFAVSARAVMSSRRAGSRGREEGFEVREALLGVDRAVFPGWALAVCVSYLRMHG